MSSARIEITLDTRVIEQIDKLRGKRTRQDFVREAIDAMLRGELGDVPDYAEWVQLQRLKQEGGSVIKQLVTERTPAAGQRR